MEICCRKRNTNYSYILLQSVENETHTKPKRKPKILYSIVNNYLKIWIRKIINFAHVEKIQKQGKPQMGKHVVKINEEWTRWNLADNFSMNHWKYPLILAFFCTILSPTLQVRPQFRPGFRRPTITAQKISKPTQSNDINDATESPTSLTTRKSSSSPYVRRRSRPTYIPTTSQTTVSATAAAIAANVAQRNNDTIVGKILQRRKFASRPSSVATANTNSNNNASERKRTNTSLQSKSRPTADPGKSEQACKKCDHSVSKTKINFLWGGLRFDYANFAIAFFVLNKSRRQHRKIQ